MAKELVIRYPALGTEQRVQSDIFGLPTGQQWAVKNEDGSTTSYQKVKLVDASTVDEAPTGTLMYVVVDD